MIFANDWQPDELEQQIGIHFKHPEHLFRAMCHPSFATLIDQPDYHHDSLIFLGDAILKLTIADYLYHNCPYLAVVNYKGLEAKLTAGEQLTKCWSSLGLSDMYPFLDLEEERPVLAQKRNNPFEAGLRALVGAIHCERGYSQTRNWLKKYLIEPLLKKYLKKTQKRLEADLQLRYWGDALLGAIAADVVYHLLPEVPVKRLNQIHGQLTNKTMERVYKEKSQALGNEENSAFKIFLVQYYQQAETETRNPFNQTKTWFEENFVEKDEILEDTIRALLRSGKPQKWIIRSVLGFSGKDYQTGRDRFYEILQEEPQNEEE